MSSFGGFEGRFDRGTQYARACYAQPLAKLLWLLKSALVGGAVLGLVQPAMAVQIVSDPGISINPGTGQGINAALLDLDGPVPQPAAAQRDDDAFSALAGFAQKVSLRSQAS